MNKVVLLIFPRIVISHPVSRRTLDDAAAKKPERTTANFVKIPNVRILHRIRPQIRSGEMDEKHKIVIELGLSDAII